MVPFRDKGESIMEIPGFGERMGHWGKVDI